MKARKHDPLAGKRRVVAMKKAKSAKPTPAHDPTAPRASAPLVTVPFHGGDLFAVAGEYADDGDRPVPVRPFCDRLGVAVQAQLAKLKGKPWAVVTMIVTTGADGKTYEMACLPLRAIPMWLATIEPNRVKAGVREALVTFQKEAADALYRHFRSRMAPAGPGLAKTSAVSPDALETILAKLTTLEEGRRADAIKMESLESTVSKLNHQLGAFRYSDNGLVGASRARTYIRNPLNTLAGKLADIKKQSKRRILNELENSVREACGHPKFTRGNTWDHLPMSDLGDALRAISHLEAKHHPEIDAHERKMIGERQLKLVK